MNTLCRTLLFSGCLYWCAYGVTAVDSLVFTIPLLEDSTSLFYSNKNERIARCISGPVIMEDSSILFFSRLGYLLYSPAGALLDSHSVVAHNRKSEEQLFCAFPGDREQLLYFSDTPKGRPTVYKKKLHRRRMREIDEEEYPSYSTINRTRLFNLAHNTVTDEMASRSYLKPFMVGFSTKNTNEFFWTVDRYFSFGSPIINEKNNRVAAFFPGIKTSTLAASNVRKLTLDALGTFTRNGHRIFVGVFAAMGNENKTYHQTLYLCDDAGNLLFTDTLLKQTNMDEVLGKDYNPDKNLYYTAVATREFVFPPAVAGDGTIWYSTVNYETRELAVHRRSYAFFEKAGSQPDLAFLVDQEKNISFTPLTLSCNRGQSGARIPAVTIRNVKGEEKRAIARDLEKNGYGARITRLVHRDVEKKIGRNNRSFPAPLNTLRDSLLNREGFGCPWAISLWGPRGAIRTFCFAPPKKVACARVVGVRDNGDILVRVDFERSAEGIVFGPDGRFRGRFIFNSQPMENRRDIIVTNGTSPCMELDYETSRKGAWFKWMARY